MRTGRDLAVAVAAFALAILCKLTALYVGIPMLYLLHRKFGSGWWKKATTWLAGVAILLPPAVWYWYAFQLSQRYGNSFGILSRGYSKFGTVPLLTSSPFYLWLLRRVFLYHFTPVAAVGLALGGILTLRQPSRGFLLAWSASVVLYVFTAATGVFYGHYHYLLPILPIGCILAGIGLDWIIRRLREWPAANRPAVRGLGVTTAVLLFGANVAWAERRFESRDRAQDSDVWKKKKVTGQLVKKLTRPDALVIVVDDQMDAVTPDKSMSPPDVFYFGDHRGWYISLAWLSDAGIEHLRTLGAQYLIVSGQSVSEFHERRKDLFEQLSRSYAKVLDSDQGIMFDLATPLRPQPSRSP
jgi:hypothetical protein